MEHRTYDEGSNNNNTLANQRHQRGDQDEKEHIDEVIHSFRQHAMFCRSARRGRLMRIQNLPNSIQTVLPNALIVGTSEYQSREKLSHEAEIRNQFFFDCMLKYHQVPNSQEYLALQTTAAGQSNNGSDLQQVDVNMGMSSDDHISKTHSVLKSLMRDWSADGGEEREQAYRPLINGVEKYITKRKRKICVPGAGLGRLAIEICSLGHHVQGNEFSMHMLLCSDFVLNVCSDARQPFQVCPFLQEGERNLNRISDVYRFVAVPDESPASILKQRCDEDDTASQFSMAAGDFVSIYSNDDEFGAWDCVVCSFFLDAAPCIVEYLQVIYNMLSNGGYLISFGPLHYHWTGPSLRPDETFDEYRNAHSNLDERYLSSIELCWDDLKKIIVNIGFELVEEVTGLRALYTCDQASFVRTEYQCVYFVARKKIA